MSKFQVTTTTEISDERISNLLCSALEGGINYWGHISEYINPNNVECKYKHLELPLIEGCGIMIQDSEDDEEAPVLLNREAMQKGLKILGEKYAWHLKAFLEENDDADTGDAFVQCSLFGDIVFG
jgi:hypothetical protein